MASTSVSCSATSSPIRCRRMAVTWIGPSMVGPGPWRVPRTLRQVSRPPAMSEGRIDVGSNGELRLGGVLDYRSGPLLREQGRGLILGAPDTALVVDCSAVEKSSSVGLSLLLAFMRDARSAGKSLGIRGLPQDMQGIARVSGLQQLLGLPA